LPQAGLFCTVYSTLAFNALMLLVGQQEGHLAIGADSTGATGNFTPVLTQEPGQTARFAPLPFMAVL